MTALLTSAFAEEAFALSAWLRKPGNAIEARMPTIMTTTKSSIKVNPLVMGDPERLDLEMIC